MAVVRMECVVIRLWFIIVQHQVIQPHPHIAPVVEVPSKKDSVCDVLPGAGAEPPIPLPGGHNAAIQGHSQASCLSTCMHPSTRDCEAVMDIGQEGFVMCVVGEVSLDILPQSVGVSPEVEASRSWSLTPPVGSTGQGEGEVSGLARECWGELNSQAVMEYLTQLALAWVPSSYPQHCKLWHISF